MFKRIWHLSLEKEPFQAIRGESDPAFPGWFATVDLPGASQCHVYKVGELQFAGTNAGLSIYDCKFTVRPETVEQSYDNLMTSILSL